MQANLLLPSLIRTFVVRITIFYYLGNRKEIRGDAADEAVLFDQGGASRRDSALPRGRLLRDVRRRRHQGERHSRHYAHAPCERCRVVCRTGWFSLPCHRHLPAQTGAGGRAGGGVRAARRPEDSQGTGQTRCDRAGDPGRGARRQHTDQQGEHLPGFGVLRAPEYGRGLSRHLHRRVLCGRGHRCLCGQTDGEPRTQGGALQTGMRGSFRRGFRLGILHLPPRRLGIFGGGEPREALPSVRHPLAQGFRCRSALRRHFGRGRGASLPRIHRASRHRPHHLPFAAGPRSWNLRTTTGCMRWPPQSTPSRRCATVWRAKFGPIRRTTRYRRAA